MSLEGKVALVTGAARGIGQACAVELARHGAEIAFCDLGAAESGAETVALVERVGRRARYYRCDVGDRSAVEAMFERVQADFGRLDICVNNAAANIRKPLIELEVSDVAMVWNVILWGVFHCSQLAARQMVKQGEGGCLLMISSVHAERAFGRSTAYNGAKAAVNQMAMTWAAELAQYRIRVNVIEPGWTDTPGERAFYTEERIKEEGLSLPLGRLANPSEIAAAARFLCSDDASYVTGSILRVDGGFVLPAAR
jgi:glucose 1-dehydrogenase